MILYVRRFILARRLTVAEREFLEAATRYMTAREAHQPSAGWYDLMRDRWKAKNRLTREARQLGLPLHKVAA